MLAQPPALHLGIKLYSVAVLQSAFYEMQEIFFGMALESVIEGEGARFEAVDRAAGESGIESRAKQIAPFLRYLISILRVKTCNIFKQKPMGPNKCRQFGGNVRAKMS